MSPFINSGLGPIRDACARELAVCLSRGLLRLQMARRVLPVSAAPAPRMLANKGLEVSAPSRPHVAPG